jgi:hypothetical protein
MAETVAVAHGLNQYARMRARARPHIVLPERSEDEDLRTNRVKLVPHACEACGELTLLGVLCTECEERSRPHQPDDPYDVVGGEDGTE